MIASVETARSIDELRLTLQSIIEDMGFASYSFLDISHPGLDAPLLVSTNDPNWNDDYRSNGFVHVDPILSAARRVNTPFDWSSIDLPERKGRRVPAAHQTMQAAADHGYREGLVVPFHYADRIGRYYSSVCTFFWKDDVAQFGASVEHYKHTLHVVLLYWAQRVVDMWEEEQRRRSRWLDSEGKPLTVVQLTDRERDVLSWAARGKKNSEVADILSISEDTVMRHTQNAMRKLGATNKTHASVLAFNFGLIDV